MKYRLNESRRTIREFKVTMTLSSEIMQFLESLDFESPNGQWADWRYAAKYHATIVVHNPKEIHGGTMVNIIGEILPYHGDIERGMRRISIFVAKPPYGEMKPQSYFADIFKWARLPNYLCEQLEQQLHAAPIIMPMVDNLSTMHKQTRKIILDL